MDFNKIYQTDDSHIQKKYANGTGDLIVKVCASSKLTWPANISPKNRLIKKAWGWLINTSCENKKKLKIKFEVNQNFDGIFWIEKHLFSATLCQDNYQMKSSEMLQTKHSQSMIIFASFQRRNALTQDSEFIWFLQNQNSWKHRSSYLV